MRACLESVFQVKYRKRTEACNSGAEMGQNRGAGIAHFTLDRHLRLQVDVANVDANDSHEYTGNKECRGEYDGAGKFDQHAQSNLDDSSECLDDGAVDGGNVLSTARYDSSGGGLIQPPVE